MLATRSTDAQVPTPTLIPTLTPTPLPSPSPSFSPLTGWAWSSNIGWISFSSLNPGAGGGAAYGVQVDLNTGRMSGYAWSSNIGWIQFGGLNRTPPSGSSGNAMVNLTSGAVTGWARACAGTLNNDPNQNLPGNCSTMNPRTDGWDGWIELSGTNHSSPNTVGYQGTSTQGVTMAMVANGSVTKGMFSGYAWGGPVVGWVSFAPKAVIGNSNPVNCPGCCTGTCGGGPDFTVTGTNVSLNSANGYTYTAVVSINRSGSDTTSQIITPSLSTQSGYTIGTFSPATCTLGSLVSCTESVQITATSPQTSITNLPLTFTGTRSDGKTHSNTVYITVTVPVAGNTLQLYVAPNSATVNPGDSLSSQFIHSTSATAIKVKQGSPFKLAWANTLTSYDVPSGNGYKCLVTPLPSGSISAWSSFNTTAVGALSEISSLATDATSAATGSYQFEISCTKYVNHIASQVSTDTQTTDAFLRIISVSEGER